MEYETAAGIKPAFTALILGGTNYEDEGAVWRALDSLATKHQNITILTGAAESDAPAMARSWAEKRGRPCITDPRGPDFLVHYLPSGCVAFPGADTATAERAGLKVWWPAGRGV